MVKPTLYTQLSNEKAHNSKLKEERQQLFLRLQEKNREAQNHDCLKALQKDYPAHNIRIKGNHLQTTSQKGNEYDLVYFGIDTFGKFRWSDRFDQTCRTTIALIDILDSLEHTVLQNYTRESNGALIDSTLDRCRLSYYETTTATKEPRWTKNEDKSQLHLMIDGNTITGFLDWDATYKKDTNQADILLPNHDRLNIYNDDYNVFDKDTLKLALSHTFKASTQTLKKALKKAITIKNNASITLQETKSDKDANTFSITKKED